MNDMVENTVEDREELLELENSNFLLDEQKFRRTQGSNMNDKMSDILDRSARETIKHQSSFHTKTDLSEKRTP